MEDLLTFGNTCAAYVSYTWLPTHGYLLLSLLVSIAHENRGSLPVGFRVNSTAAVEKCPLLARAWNVCSVRLLYFCGVLSAVVAVWPNSVYYDVMRKRER